MQPFVGIDLGKAALSAALGSQGPLHTLRNDRAGHRALLKLLSAQPPELVILEAGAYTRELVDALREAEVPLRVESPARIRHFAKADGLRAKTDRIDCRMIARYGEVIHPAPQPAPPSELATASRLEARIRQYTDDITREKIRREHQHKSLLRDADALIKMLQKRREALFTQALQLIADSAPLRARFGLLCSRKGIKERLALTLLCVLPELGELPDKTLAALVGVAPWTRESGQLRWRSRTGGGRAAARSALFMAALVAKRVDPELRGYADRLAAVGKCKLVVQVACMHKLLRQMNAVLRRGTPWEVRAIG